MEYQDISLDQPDPVPSFHLCIDGITRHMQAYESSLFALEAENRILRERVTYLTQQLESAKQQLIHGSQGVTLKNRTSLVTDTQTTLANLGNLKSAYSNVIPAPPDDQAKMRSASSDTATQLRVSPGKRLPSKQLTHLRTLQMHSRAVSAVTWVQDFFITASRDASCRVWYVPKEQSDSSRPGPLMTYRTAAPLTSARCISNRYLMLSNTSSEVIVHSVSAPAIASLGVYANVESMNSTLIRTETDEKSLSFKSPVWSIVELDGHAVCVGAGFAALVEFNGEKCAITKTIRLLDPFCPKNDEPMLCSFVTRVGGTIIATIRERYIKADDLQPPGFIPDPADVVNYRRSGMRLVKINPEALSNNATVVTFTTQSMQCIQVTGLAPIFNTHVIVSTTTPDTKLLSYRVDDHSSGAIKVISATECNDSDIFTAISTCDGYVVTAVNAAINAHPRIYIFQAHLPQNRDAPIELKRVDTAVLDSVYGSITAIGTRRVEDGIVVVLCGCDGDIHVKCYGI
ncbi:Putative WD-repeat family protein [Giardia duodenalis]|uniref:Putative WD-repeat family protein n=1 Tax=Giardia intestinalis TaxID=5741 RepID=V6TGC9_GIAIN|nr:Putative WD-repeat family protein [Giardia intestinalis]